MVFCQTLKDHHPARMTKADNDFPKRFDFKDMKLAAKTRDTRNIAKKLK